jgi:4-amino-4-deoxy-L-arabinose transferase-like glycosyltransferase
MHPGSLLKKGFDPICNRLPNLGSEEGHGMFHGLNNRLGHYLLLLSAGTCLFLVNLGGPSLWDIDEGRNASTALAMRESGDWVVPIFNGQLRSHKPALLYWLQVAAYGVFGIDEFAARLPSALAAMLTLLLVYELGRRMFNASTGLTGSLILASTTLFCASAHFANPDALLVTFTTATLLAVWLGVFGLRRRPIWFALAGLTTGLAILAKGPVGLVLPAAVVGLFLVWSGRWRLLFGRVWIVPAILCGLISLPWYILVAVETKREFLTEFLLIHNLERALAPMEDHSGPAWYYLAVLVIGLVPWSAFLGSSLWYGASAAFRQENTPPALAAESDAIAIIYGYRFLWCWIAVYLLAFTLAATKLPNYILPIFPPFALLIGRFLDRWRCGVLELPAWVQPTSLATLTLAGLTTIVGLLIAGGAVDVGLLHGRSWRGLEQWSALGAVPLIGAAVGGWCLYRQRRTAFVAVMVVAALGLLVPLAAAGTVALNQFRAPRPLVEQAGALQRDQEIRVGGYQLEFLPSLNFYVQRNVRHCQSPEEVLDFLRQPLTVFLFLPRRDWEQLAPRVTTPYRLLASHREMYRAGEVVVVTNH